jgi:hypothetical protein
MSEDAQKYRDAAKRVQEKMLTGHFGSTGIDLADAPDLTFANKIETPKPVNSSDNPMMRAVLGGFDTGNQGAAMVGLMTNGGNNSSVIATNALSADNGMGGSAGKQDDKKKQEELDRLLAQLNDLYRQREYLNNRIRENEEKIAKSEAFDQRATGYISDLEKGKIPEKNADGTFKDQELQEKLKAYEREHGVKVDRNNADALMTAIRKIKEDELRKREEWKRENNDYKKQLDNVDSTIVTTEQRVKNATEGYAQSGSDKDLVVLNKKEQAKKEISFDDLNGDEPVVAANETMKANMSVASSVDAEGVNAGKITTAFNSAQTGKADLAANADLALINKPTVV